MCCICGQHFDIYCFKVVAFTTKRNRVHFCFWPACKPEGPLFSAELVSLSVCLCLWLALLPFTVDRFWWNLVTRTLLWSSLAATIMVHIGRTGTVRRLFENFKKFSKITESEFQNSGSSFFASVSPVYCKKIWLDSNKTDGGDTFWSLPLSPWCKHGRDTPVLCYVPAASTACSLQAPTRCGMLVAQRMTPFAVIKVLHRRAANRYIRKLHIGRVHKFGMDRVRKFGIWARSELGIGHDVRRAFRTGGVWNWGHSRAVKTNRLVIIFCQKHFDTVGWASGRLSSL